MAEEPMVTRTYRAAIRIGEDYITIEETISLPPNASDDEIAQAVDTGLRIYRAQQTALEAQMQTIREQHTAGPVRILDPDSPASDKQRSYLEYLVNSIGIADEDLQTMLRERQTSYETLTKGVASDIIDQLKTRLDAAAPLETAAEEQPEGLQQPLSEVSEAAAPARGNTPASTRQIAALQRVAAQHGVNLSEETRTRFGTTVLEELSSNEAGALLQELQRR